jgi:hypothetical protein
MNAPRRAAICVAQPTGSFGAFRNAAQAVWISARRTSSPRPS